jgi:hypothetical protein
MVAMDQVAELLPPVPQCLALSRFGDDDHVEIGVVIGGSLREGAIHDHRAHGSVGFRPCRSSLGHPFSRNDHQHLPSAGWAKTPTHSPCDHGTGPPGRVTVTFGASAGTSGFGMDD